IIGIDAGITVESGAIVDNAGELLVDWIHNEGNLYNRSRAKTSLDRYETTLEAFTYNFVEGQFETITLLDNEGRFDNSGICVVRGDFRNTAVFNQIRTSSMEVSGDLVLSPGSILNQSEESDFYLVKGKRISIREKLAVIFQ
ncbi:MAG: hypothetical protein AAF206_18090, partial [Bacteroidota bacterium]